jgi:para-nitrobenzyl esterase
VSAPCVVATASGKVRGVVHDGVFRFRGIAYGDDTGGANRLRAPRPVAWTGVRDAIAHGPRCPQLEMPMQAPHLAWIHDASPCAEDCLVLNVDTGTLDDSARLPVMVHLHGGGFKVWGAGAPGLDGGNLARRGAVVVSFNHRLNLFGFLHLPDAAAGERHAANAGLLDCVAALEWVRLNIARFGGDPDNVTLFGQSGGGSKVAMLMAMPRARGLFHKAIIQSASSLLAPASLDDAEAATDRFLAQLGLNRRSDLRALHELPAARLLDAMAAAVRDAGQADHFRPVVDGHVLPTRPFEDGALRLSAHVPLMTGWCENEQRWAFAGTPDVYRRSAPQVLGATARLLGVTVDEAAPLVDAYRRSRPQDSPGDVYAQIVGDHRYRRSVTRAAQLQAAHGGAPVYLYLLAWKSPVQGGLLRSPHTLCLPFVFANADRATGITGDGSDREALQRQMAGAWVAFARNGNPNHVGVPNWHPFSPGRRSTLVFDGDTRLVDDPLREERLAFEPYPSYVPAFGEAGRPL